ncbi:MAG: glycine--tRNA ligase subunit beta, partial [Alphaproteobacteria bacterium]|nr:glycine--tRNA ligase subunit beta [Alphaproteobacteria bacterium]
TYVPPRRIVAVAKGLPKAIEATEAEKRGPKLGAPQGAIDGFCKGAGIDASALEERDGYYFAVIRSAGGDVAPVLKSIIEKILNGFHWPKSMRWGARPLVWVRPLQSILCLFDGAVVPVSLGHVTAGNSTKGHRFLSDNAPFTVTASEDYFAKLRAAHVIVNQDERRDTIEKSASAEAAKHGLTVKPDAGLLDEVTGLVEWPVVLIGGFEERYLDLPQEVPTTVMRAHQKYFALQNGGKLANKFVVVSNMVANDGGKVIVSGNERVLKARLSDGQFFYDQDLKTPLADWNKGLSDMVFHAKIGSVAEKVARIKTLAAKLAPIVGADATDVARAAELCKADLTTGMVGEFPELQGLMGRYYATAQGEKATVADAIRDHYSPLGPTDETPKAPVSVTIALADKLDTLVSMFAIGEKPTGSKDPFALRRAALGIIRLILENGLRLPLNQFVNAELLEFFIGRLKVSLKEEGIAHDRIDAVLKSGNTDDLTLLVARVRAVDGFLKTQDGANLLAGAKRALNILKAAKSPAAAQVDAGLLEAAEEKALASAASDVATKVDALLAKEDFAAAMQQISTLRPAIDAFFEKVIVNADDEKVRANRLALLAMLNGVFIKIADFSLIEG